MRRFLFIIPLFALLCGCWDSKELSDIQAIAGIGLDLTDDGIIFSTELIKVTGGKNETTQGEFFSRKCENIEEGINALERHSGGWVDFACCDIVYLGEDFAKNGIEEAVDYMMSGRGFKKSTVFAVVDGVTAREFLAQKSETEPVVSFEASKIIKNGKKYGLVNREVMDIWNDINTGRNFKLCRLYRAEKTGQIMTGDAAFFKDGRLEGCE